MKVLILMATYNGEKYIKEQILTIINQNAIVVDLLVSDDDSSDATVQVVQNLINEGHPIRLIQRPVGTGSAARNFVSMFQLVENEDDYDFFAFADQDDVWLPNKLSRATECLINTQSALYFSNLVMWEQSGKKSVIDKSHCQKKYDYLFEGGSAGCTYVFNKKLFKLLRAKIASLNYLNWKTFSHDWLVYFIARNNDFKVCNDNEALILYRIHKSNVHGHLNSKSFSSIRARIKLIRDGWYIENINGFIPLLAEGSDEYRIYAYYKRNLIYRLYILSRYNFKLMRSSKKFIQFFILSLLPIKN